MLVIIIRHRFMAMDNKSCAAVARKYRYLAMVKSVCSPEEGAVSLSFSQYNVMCVTFLPGAAVSLSVKGEELMEQKAKRSPGGKLALWVFYAFCGYFLWAMARYWWVVGKIESVPGATIDGDLGSTSGKWLGALLGFLVLSVVGAILGAIAWYTRPDPRMHEQHD